MGFLKFLKRDKSKELDLGLEGMEDLDMPPMPPDFKEEEFGKEKGFEGLPELPELPEGEEGISEIEEEPLPELELPEKPGPELKVPSMPESWESVNVPVPPPPPRPLFGVRQRPLFGWPKPEEQKPGVEVPEEGAAEVPKPRPEIGPYERFERAAVEEERAILKHKEAAGPVYIRADKFRDIVTGTSAIKNDLKIANQSIVKLNEIDTTRGRALEKWKNVIIDLQKKLIFMDKTLFKR